MMKRLAIGVLIGMVLGSAVAASAQRSYVFMTINGYRAMGHDSKVIYLWGLADATAAMALMTGAATGAGGDPTAQLSKLANCIGSRPTQTVLNTLAAGIAAEGPSEYGAAPSVITELMQSCM